MSSTYERIYAVVNRIPRGRVATYGQVAVLAGMPRAARQVGYALNAVSEEQPVAWHRVVNARGEISARAEPLYEKLQRSLLEGEGVVFGPNARIPLARFGWRPKPRAKPVRERGR